MDIQSAFNIINYLFTHGKELGVLIVAISAPLSITIYFQSRQLEYLKGLIKAKDAMNTALHIKLEGILDASFAEVLGKHRPSGEDNINRSDSSLS